MAWFAVGGAAASVSGPGDREITDPNTITSQLRPDPSPLAIEDLFITRTILSAALSPRGDTAAISTNLNGRFNVWTVATNGSWPVQLANSDDRQADLAWSPDGRWIAYKQDKGGNELWDIYVVPVSGGAPTNITNTPDIRDEHPVWSRDGQTIACAYKPKDAPSYDIAVIDVATRTLRKMTKEGDPRWFWAPIGFSPDGRTLYANRANISSTDGDIYAIDPATSQVNNLTPHRGATLNIGTSVSPDGAAILMTSTRNGAPNAAALDLATRRLQWVTDTQWEVSTGAFSADGQTFSFTVNADGRSKLYLGDRRDLSSKELVLPSGLNALLGQQHFSADGGKVLFDHEALNAPTDLWVYDVKAERTFQLTHSAVGALTPQALPPAQLVHYRSFDGRLISAVLQMPFNLKRDGTNPAVIMPHGGPTYQSKDWWDPFPNALATQGYIVLMPNPRGSSGYGSEFQNANHQDLGGGDLRDEMFGLKWLLATSYVDPTRVGVAGGSYGGFMTLMMASKEPSKFAAAVDMYGPLDFNSMLKNADPFLAEYVRSLLGDPKKNPKIYEADSPITYVQNIRAPLLVLQGENDRRIPKEESQRLVQLLKAHGQVVESVYYPDEGHGFDKVEHQLDSARRMVSWFDRYLRTPLR